MRSSRHLLGLAAAALLLAVAFGCSDSPNRAAPSPTPASSLPAPADRTPSSDAGVASAAASELVRTYYSVRDKLRQNPEESLDQLQSVAVSTELSAQQNLFKRERKDGLHQTGDTKVVELTVQSVSLDNSDPAAGKVPTVHVDVCYDVSAVDVVDPSGKSIVSPDRTDTGWIRYSVANYEWDSNPANAWRVASSENIERTPCAGS